MAQRFHEESAINREVLVRQVEEVGGKGNGKEGKISAQQCSSVGPVDVTVHDNLATYWQIRCFARSLVNINQNNMD